MEKQQRQYAALTLRKIDSLRETHASVVGRLRARVEEVDSIEQKHLQRVAELEQASKALTSELAAVKGCRDDALSKLDALKLQAENLTKERDLLKDRVSSLEGEVMSLSSAKSCLEESLSSERTRYSEVDNKYTSVCKDLDESKSQVRISSDNISNLTNSNQQLTQSLSIEVKKNETQEEQLLTLKNKCSSLDKEIIELKEKCTEFTNQLNEKIKNEDTLKLTISDLKEQSTAQKNEEEKKRIEEEEAHRLKEKEVEERWKSKMKEVTEQCDAEKKELQRLSGIASEAYRSGSGSVEALRERVAATRREMDALRESHSAEVSELRALLSVKARKGRRGADSTSSGALEHAHEYEYLRNVLLQYLRGRQTQTLAKVLCAVLKFDEQQQKEVLEHHLALQATSTRQARPLSISEAWENDDTINDHAH